MAYGKTTWANGDVISIAKLNNLETQYDQLLSTAGIIGTTPLVDGAVTSAKLAANAVTSSWSTTITSSLSTTSTTLADFISLSITPTGGPLLVLFSAPSLTQQNGSGYLVFTLNGVDYPIASVSGSASDSPAVIISISALTAGTYTAKIRARHSSGTGPCSLGTGTDDPARLTILELKR